ncbi:FRG domain-containing protein [Sutcliffiella horikoshii]|uniref:FRG domain-containing protein n=1 Tax=Sutcliffiella horikoshii TaxID=79883 RepID=UPI001CBBF6EC|nr:FRG domain-containing protein [Sutcliffiella horikoshii]UAL47732.1 FRG domain-containing protein [Sutcliffiella horikoshii]
MIKYITKYNQDDVPTLFGQIILDIELIEDPPFYIIVTDDNQSCFLGYIEVFAEFISCRVVSRVFELNQVLKNPDNYILEHEKEIKEIRVGDFKSIELNIRSLKEALEVSSIIVSNKNSFLFRGQANKEWTIESSLFRKGYNQSKEPQLYSEIRRINHDQFSSNDFNQLTSDMQHYGIPTRLVDWTSNIFNAIYFACVSGMEDLSKDGAVFLMDCPEILNVDSETYKDIQSFLEYRYGYKDDVEAIFPILSKVYESDKKYKFIEIRLSNERIKRQNGYFSLCFEASEDEANGFLKYMFNEYLKRNNSNVPDQHLDKVVDLIRIPLDNSIRDPICHRVEEYNSIASEHPIDLEGLKEALDRFSSIKPFTHIMNDIQKHDQHIKIIIPSTYKKDITIELDKVGINSSTIYPDLEGMTKYIKEKYSN